MPKQEIATAVEQFYAEKAKLENQKKAVEEAKQAYESAFLSVGEPKMEVTLSTGEIATLTRKETSKEVVDKDGIMAEVSDAASAVGTELKKADLGKPKRVSELTQQNVLNPDVYVRHTHSEPELKVGLRKKGKK